MASPELKQDVNMEAGLLSTREEERMMSKEALLPQDERSIRPRTRRASPGRRAIIAAIAVCCLLGLSFVSVSGASRMCPGHLRHTTGQQTEPAVTKDGAVPAGDMSIEIIKVDDNSNSLLAMAKRQANGSTTADPGTTDTPTEPPSDTSEPPTNTPPNTPTSTAEPPDDSTTSVPPPDTTPTEPPTTPPTTTPPTTSPQPPTTSSQRPPETTNSEPDQETTTSRRTTREPEPTSETSSSSPSSDDDQETSTDGGDDTEEPTQSTIFSGTRTTSKPVPKTLTSTLPNGGVTTLTSTSWVAVVPSAQSTGGNDPDLQNAAARLSSGTILAVIAGAVFGGMLLM